MWFDRKLSLALDQVQKALDTLYGLRERDETVQKAIYLTKQQRAALEKRIPQDDKK